MPKKNKIKEEIEKIRKKPIFPKELSETSSRKRKRLQNLIEKSKKLKESIDKTRKKSRK